MSPWQLGIDGTHGSHLSGLGEGHPPPLPFPSNPDLWEWFINDNGVAFVCVRRFQAASQGGYNAFPGQSAKWLKTNVRKVDDISISFLRAVLVEIVKLIPGRDLGTIEPWYTLSIGERTQCERNCIQNYRNAMIARDNRGADAIRRATDGAAGMLMGVVNPEAMVVPPKPKYDPLSITRKLST